VRALLISIIFIAGCPGRDVGLPDAGVPTDDAGVVTDAGEIGEASDEGCRDGEDNDDDTFIDCDDFDCDGFATCGFAETGDEACANDQDDDGDGFSDCSDFGCATFAECGPAERDNAACSNGVDDDGDTFIDCEDFGCDHQSVCDPNEDSIATCSDGVDNDQNGFGDCADFACEAFSVCASLESGDAACSDGVDNDGDDFTDCVDFDCDEAPTCNAPVLRVVTWNVQEIFGGDPPSLQGEAAIAAVATMLLRMNADVACLNEVHDDEGFALDALAAAADYPFIFQGELSTPMAGGLTNACLSRRPFVVARSRSSDDISSDSRANETGRDITEVTVAFGASTLTILSAHLKAGFSDGDHLRRHVEALRLAQLAESTEGAVVAMGDFNEEITNPRRDAFLDEPDDMPFSWRLGSDLSFPITYDPFGALASAGLDAGRPLHEDTENEATRIPSGRRIDYLMSKGATRVAEEVYDPCVDDGIGGMLKAGEPVACGTAEDASDHWPVMVDLSL
jgi:endonuclease/exonuclease/phosphatase family metal-dependent hydrolase